METMEDKLLLTIKGYLRNMIEVRRKGVEKCEEWMKREQENVRK